MYLNIRYICNVVPILGNEIYHCKLRKSRISYFSSNIPKLNLTKKNHNRCAIAEVKFSRFRYEAHFLPNIPYIIYVNLYYL